MTRLALGVLALSLGGVFVPPVLRAQETPALAGFRLGSDKADLELEDCGTPPTSSAFPEDKQIVVCRANDSVAVYLADGELFNILFVKQVDLTPAEQWREMRDWATLTFGEPDTVGDADGGIMSISWRANAERPWQLVVALIVFRPRSTRRSIEYTDCRRARPGYCTGSDG